MSYSSGFHLYLDAQSEHLVESLLEVQQVLQSFAEEDGFQADQLAPAFGKAVDSEHLQNLGEQFAQGDFSGLPSIAARPSQNLNGAMGVYVSETNRIYLSESLLQNASQSQIVAVLLEEIGHSLDTQLNATDSAGDEGAIFSALVRGQRLSEAQLAALQAENDQATLLLDGQQVTVEQAAVTVNIAAGDVNDGDTSSIANLLATPGADGLISLREAIVAANNTAGADTIDFDGAGTITLGGTELLIADDLSLDGDVDNDGTSDVTVDANQQSRVIRVEGPGDETVALDGLIITGGLVDQQSGGGILNKEDLTITNSTIRDNTVTSGTVVLVGSGGGIANDNTGTLTITRSIITGNVSGNDGGGIYATGNTANGASVTITDSQIYGNIAGDNGGGIANSVFIGGGGSAPNASLITITNTTISGNSATDGGGVSNFGQNADNGAVMNITNSTISSNTATSTGGGLYSRGQSSLYGATITLTNSTVTQNEVTNAVGRGGGIFNTGFFTVNAGRVIVSNSIIAQNTASIEAAVHQDLPTANAPIIDQGNNLIDIDSQGLFTTSTLVGTTATPLDPGLNPLADNGGLTQTHTLTPNSPAVDAGDNAAVPTEAALGVDVDGDGSIEATAISVDQRGGIRIAGASVDIGAVEANPSITSLSSSSTDGAYKEGDNLNITVNFSEDISLVGGNLELTLDTGDTVSITPFANANTASATYTIPAGANSSDLNVTGISLAGSSTLQNATGIDTSLTIPTGQSLSDSSDLVIDTTLPTVAISSTALTPSDLATIPATITFSEAVSQFVAGDITVSNGSATNLSTSDNQTYTFDLLPTADGTVTVDIAASVAEDGAGNGNGAAPQFSIDSDRGLPTLVSFTRQSPTDSTTDADSLAFRATFSEAVQAVDASDFAVTGTTASITAVTPISPTTYDITVAGGDLADLDGAVALDLSNVQDITDLDANALATIEPNVDESYTLFNNAMLSVANASVTEGNGGTTQLVFDVTLTGNVSTGFSVDFTTGDSVTSNSGTTSSGAIAGTDYIAQTGTLSFNGTDGEVQQITIEIEPDAVVEPDETFSITLSNVQANSQNVAIAQAPALGSIVNDDIAMVSIDDVRLSEGDAGTTEFNFTVSLDKTASEAVSLYVNTQDQSAIAGEDYEAVTERLITIPAGQSSTVFTVNGIGDLAVEADEQFAVNLSRAQLAGVADASRVAIADAQGIGTLINNDINEVQPPARPLSSNLLNLSLTQGQTDTVNEVIFVVTDAQGGINGLTSSDAGFTEALLNNAEVLLSTLEQGRFPELSPSRTLTVNDSQILQFALIEAGSLDSLRNGGIGTLQLLTPDDGDGDRLISASVLQNQPSLTLRSSNDSSAGNGELVFSIDTNNTEIPIGSGLQGSNPETELLDFRGLTGTTTATFEVYRDAKFDNVVGFYFIEDEQGQVRDAFGNLLNPGEVGYIEAAMANRLTNVELSAENGTTSTFTAEIRLGQLLSTFIVVDGTVDALLDANSANDPTVYFTHMGANADRVDHVRLLGNNVFGFEDLPGGGDSDFDDLIIKARFT